MQNTTQQSITSCCCVWVNPGHSEEDFFEMKAKIETLGVEFSRNSEGFYFNFIGDNPREIEKWLQEWGYNFEVSEI